jgi:ATP-binding cassette subfamily B protein
VTDLEEISKIFSEPLDLQPDTGTKKLSRFSGSIKFEDVYFGYKNRPALRGLSFEVPAGSRVAIVGPSGAGKSTIVKLLFRLYDLEKGKIKFDDINITDIDARALYSLIALVPQETTLFNDTIEYNIRFGKPDATSDEIKRAVRLANLDKLISRLPDGLATVVGERGVKLSGGEKQRVSVARAILKDPKVLVFDEATSNLDAESEAEIIKSIREVSSGRTTISIAHRLPTIIDNDVIFVLDNGSLAEKGTHQELLSKKGVYWRLWQNFEKEENNVVQIM